MATESPNWRTAKEWNFTTDDVSHYVTLRIDLYQRRVVELDDHIVIDEKVNHNGGSKYQFEKDGHQFEIVILAAWQSWNPFSSREERSHLYVDGVEIDGRKLPKR